MDLLNEQKAAGSLGLDPKTLRRWRWAGKGPVFYRIGGSIRYRIADLEAFINESRVTRDV
jgi:predicted site-specific integrase-resolvase